MCGVSDGLYRCGSGSVVCVWVREVHCESGSTSASILPSGTSRVPVHPVGLRDEAGVVFGGVWSTSRTVGMPVGFLSVSKVISTRP